jgi:hypothetical protein
MACRDASAPKLNPKDLETLRGRIEGHLSLFHSSAKLDGKPEGMRWILPQLSKCQSVSEPIRAGLKLVNVGVALLALAHVSQNVRKGSSRIEHAKARNRRRDGDAQSRQQRAQIIAGHLLAEAE